MTEIEYEIEEQEREDEELYLRWLESEEHDER